MYYSRNENRFELGGWDGKMRIGNRKKNQGTNEFGIERVFGGIGKMFVKMFADVELCLRKA
jgi:hypothetical protein